MPYEKSLDEQVLKQTKEFGETRLTVGVFSYNGGEKKLQISRENKIQGGDWQFVKLGRLSKDEAASIVPMIEKSISNM